MNDVGPSLMKVYVRAEILMWRSKVLSPIQEGQYANIIFWKLDSSEEIAKEVYSFSVSAMVSFMSMFLRNSTKGNKNTGIEFEKKAKIGQYQQTEKRKIS